MTAPGPGARMAAEIAEQPSVVNRLLSQRDGPIGAIAAVIRAAAPTVVQFAARGSSAHAATYGSYVFEVLAGLPTGWVQPSVTTRYAATARRDRMLVIAVSQSGESPDIVATVRSARQGGALTLALTNCPRSALAQEAHLHLDLDAGPEQAVAATKTYVAECAALYLLADALRPDGPRGVGRLVSALDAGVELTWPTALAEELASSRRILVTARGFDLATAQEAALKIIETTGRSAHAYSAAELLHGPIALADPSSPLVAIGAGVGPAVEAAWGRGATVHHLRTDGPGDYPLPSAQLHDEVAPIVNIVALQRVAWLLSVTDGADPDRPHGLTKVTQTL